MSILLTVATLLWSAFAVAWEPIFQRGGLEIYAEPTAPAAVMRIRLRYEYPTTMPPKDGWPAYRSSIESRVIDCQTGKSGVQGVLLFPQRGATGVAFTGISRKGQVPMEAPAPGTVGAAVIEAVCRRPAARL